MIDRWWTQLRVGMLSALAYRGEFFVWILTTNMPLVMMLLWTRVAREAPVGRFREAGFVAYFLTTLIVRFLVGSWVVWQLTWDIREGSLSLRLLRPVHPFAAYAAENLGQIPLRLVVVTPVVVALLAAVGPAGLSHDPAQWALLPVCVAGAWALQYCAMLCFASLALYWRSALSVFEVWNASMFVFSGYLLPLELLPRRLEALSRWMPFRYMLSLPLETALGLCDRAATLRGLAAQWLWVTFFLCLALALWHRGVRRFEAWGG